MFIFLLILCDNSTTIIFLFFFKDTATTEIYTLSLHDALTIRIERTITAPGGWRIRAGKLPSGSATEPLTDADRKSTRLNSSHTVNSYAVFCLKKKKQ